MGAPPSRYQILPYWRSIVGVLAPLLLLPLPVLSPTPEARCGYVMIIMALYWMTEAVPLAVTSLIPVFGFPLLGVLGTDVLTEVYMTETNMMFLGGLAVAIAVEHSNLHRRIALFVLINAGQSPRRLMMGFMMVTMFLSMWISNTATTAMMVPIVEAIMLELFPKEAEISVTKIDMKEFTNEAYQEDGSENTPNKHLQELKAAVSKLEDKEEDKAEGNEEEHPDEVEARERTLSTIKEEDSDDPASKLSTIGRKMRICLMLSVAYSANIGGTGVVTGTTPNLILMAELKKSFSEPTGLTFASWMAFNIPGMVICVVIAWAWLQILFIGIRGTGLGESNKDQQNSVKVLLARKYRELGSVTFHEAVVMTLFICLVIMWLFRSPEFVPGWAHWFVLAYGDVDTSQIGDATPVMLIVILLFLIPKKLNFWMFRDPEDKSPVERSEGCLNWQVVEAKVPWGIVLLLGGGFAMAEACEVSGLSDWIGNQLEAFDVMPPGAIVFVICMLTAMLTEVTSNTATASILMPVLKSLSLSINVNPIYLMLPTAICCSYAFMLPVATPPNAIVFAATRMRTVDMMKAGFAMNVICVCIETLMINTLGIPLFDVRNFPEWANSTTSAL